MFGTSLSAGFVAGLKNLLTPSGIELFPVFDKIGIWARKKRRFLWLVFDRDDVDICVKNPGHDVDLWITASMRTLVELWLGHVNLSTAIGDESIQLDGDNKEIASFSTWFTCSPFAKYGRLPAA